MRDFDENPTIEGLTHSRNLLYKLLQKERQRVASFRQLAKETREDNVKLRHRIDEIIWGQHMDEYINCQCKHCTRYVQTMCKDTESDS